MSCPACGSPVRKTRYWKIESYVCRDAGWFSPIQPRPCGDPWHEVDCQVEPDCRWYDAELGSDHWFRIDGCNMEEGHALMYLCQKMTLEQAVVYVRNLPLIPVR